MLGRRTKTTSTRNSSDDKALVGLTVVALTEWPN